MHMTTLHSIACTDKNLKPHLNSDIHKYLAVRTIFIHTIIPTNIYK